MANLIDFARLSLFFDETFVLYITSLEHVTNSGQQRVDLLNEGLGGFTPGAGDCTIAVGFAVPSSGQEAPFQQRCASGAYVTMQIPVGAEQYAGNGKLMDVTFNQGTNANLEGNFNWTGQLAEFE